MQNGRHLLKKVSMTSSVYFPLTEKTAPFGHSILIILKESKAQHKELLKIIILCIDTKDNARQGYFYLESVFFSSIISIQTQHWADMLKYWFSFQSISSWIPVTQLKLKVDKMWLKDHSAEILGSEFNFSCYNFRRHRLYISKTERNFKGQLIESSHLIDEENCNLEFDRFVQSCSVQHHGH